MNIPQTSLAWAYDLVKTKIEKATNEPLGKVLHNHPFFEEKENYKYEISTTARDIMMTKRWQKDFIIGEGNIKAKVLETMMKTVGYNGKNHTNNLVNWRKKDDFKKLKNTKQVETIFFNFFKSKIKDEVSFQRMEDLNLSYQMIAYLFFIKTPKKYLPISQQKFDKIFKTLQVDFKTSGQRSWENYTQYNQFIKQTKTFLAQYHEKPSLIDAHSFLWYVIDHDNETDAVNTDKSPVQKEKTSQEVRTIIKQELYAPKALQEKVTINEELLNKTHVDFIALQIKKQEIGDKAEQIVLAHERHFLKINGRSDLADRIKHVANDYKLGYDILSFELDGTEKQIEVKALSAQNGRKAFYLSANELKKSQILNNYYLYGVTNLDATTPDILKIQKPNFEEETLYQLVPITYKVFFD